MMDRITYSDLLDIVAEKTGAPKERVLELMRGIVEVIRHGLERDGRVVIRGLGRFELRWQEAHEGRNPRTGEALEIPAHSHVHFRPDSALQGFINRKYAHLKPEMLSDVQTLDVKELEPEPMPVQDDSTRLSEAEEDTSQKRKSRRWFWLIPAVAVVILLILFWPRPEPTTPEKTETAALTPAEPEATKDAGAPAEERTVEPSPGIPGGEHRVLAGDQLWGLSDRYYGNVYLWPHIYGVNDAAIPNPDMLSIGKTILIPPLEGVPGRLSSGDKTKIADGYMQVYLAYRRMGRKRAYTYLWVVKQSGGRSALDDHRDSIDDRDMERVDAMEGSVLVR